LKIVSRDPGSKKLQITESVPVRSRLAPPDFLRRCRSTAPVEREGHQRPRRPLRRCSPQVSQHDRDRRRQPPGCVPGALWVATSGHCRRPFV